MGSIKDKYKGFKYLSWVVGFILLFVFFLVAGVIVIISFFDKSYNYILNNFMTYGFYIVILFSISLFYYLLYIYSFICPHCLKTIFFRKIVDITCPFCNEGKKGLKTLMTKCSCGGVIKFYECPHCHKPIDLFAEFDRYELTKRRYEEKIK